MKVLHGIKILGIVSAIVVTIVITATIGIYFFIGSSCKNEIVFEAQSPDKLFKAIVFRRNCGATTGFSTQVSVLKASKELGNSNGNVFVADTDHGDAPSMPGGGPKIDVEWKAPGILLISHHSAARIFKAKQKESSVTIQYQTTEP